MTISILTMVNVPHKMVRLDRMSDGRGLTFIYVLIIILQLHVLEFVCSVKLTGIWYFPAVCIIGIPPT